MLLVRSETVLNLLINLGFILVAEMDVRASIITALMMFVFEIGGDSCRDKKDTTACKQNRVNKK